MCKKSTEISKLLFSDVVTYLRVDVDYFLLLLLPEEVASLVPLDEDVIEVGLSNEVSLDGSVSERLLLHMLYR